jgi:hypothetical protein
MAIDFPASPTNGQVFAAANGISYVYASSPGIWAAQVVTPIGNTDATTVLGATVACAVANTFIDGPNTGSIGASGQKWMIIGQCVYVNNSAAGMLATTRIYDGTTSLSSGISYSFGAGTYHTITLCVVVTLTAATTFTLQGTDNAGASSGGMVGGASTGQVSTITAVRLT